MKIEVKHFIRAWYVTVFLFILCALLMILFFMQRIELKKEIKDTSQYYEKIKEDIIVTERDRQLKTLSMYNLIISTYGNKYHRKYNEGKKRHYQGLEPRWQRPLFNRKCYEYERLLGIPHFTFHTTAKFETCFNPLSETRWENGELKEAGIFHNRTGAVGQALIFLKELYAINPRLASNFEFEFKDMSSLFDPINALKVQALNYWGYMRKTGNQQVWYITIVHWGETRIAPYYYSRKNDGILPEHFTFNKNTIREDVRDPLQYWGIWYANFGQFSRFRIEVGVETWYDKLYKQECSRMEWQFIQSWKYVKELKRDVEELKDYQLTIKKEHQKMLDNVLKKTTNIDKKYRELHGLLKSGKFRKANDVLRMWKGHFMELVIDFTKEKKAKHKKIVLLTYFIIIGIWLSLALWKIIDIIIIIIRKIIKKIREKKKKEIKEVGTLM